ncbi:hypothetical protein QMK19_05805 [Streptomyces sp. H10-C2]|uniref:SCO2583/SCO2584 N-terminal domain-containing protein n=1 Tax=unclassified Streptomyces TaxID=2593676 RepID=UPI0024BB5AA2|nr:MULTISPECIES: hypothetical protein [unclassified Streptomyces]MDJ0340158.1 hypothetical protein [Streptomyces sp. PH10-H1]MDJ0369205.1 hypothetical protein [Streptomyces sp. H10-C2]
MPDDDEFASLVFDEDFIRSAPVHEPTARQRMLAAARARAEAEAVTGSVPVDPVRYDDSESDDLYLQHARMAEGRPYRGGSVRWHRSVAWLLAVLMGIGVVALTFAAVYRGAGGGRQPAVPAPPSSGRIGTQTLPPVAATQLP